MKYREYKIAEDEKSVYLYLKKNGFSENYISNLRKKEGYILLNDKIANTRTPIFKNDVLKIESSPNEKTTILPCILPLDVVYEDEYYILINKPSEISCMPNRSHYSNNLAGAICNYFKDDNFVLRIINRLDYDTCGLMLVAKDSISQKEVTNIEKIYHAVCQGKIDKAMVIDKKIETISQNGVNQRKRIISENGKEAKTFVFPINFNEDYSLVALKLEHGRTHQIRIHLSSTSHPLIGDELYGEKSDLISHTALICKEMSFFHPYLKKTLSFQIDYPKDFEELLKSTNLTNKKA